MTTEEIESIQPGDLIERTYVLATGAVLRSEILLALPKVQGKRRLRFVNPTSGDIHHYSALTLNRRDRLSAWQFRIITPAKKSAGEKF